MRNHHLPFSERFGYTPPPKRCPPDEVPQQLRPRLVEILDDLRGESLPGAYSLVPRLTEKIGRKPEQHPGTMQQLRELIYNLEWYEVYDACEALPKLTKSTSERTDVIEVIEALFASLNLPYRMTDNGIEWRHSEPASRIQTEARRLLASSPSFQGPATEWDKAYLCLNQRPPDTENCILQAVKAMEATARVICNSTKDFGRLSDDLKQRLNAHSALVESMKKIYAYRGDEPGVGHGTPKPLKGKPEEAELILHWCAAAITYMIRKFESK